MEWTLDKPTTPGYYAWKKRQAYGGFDICRHLAKVIDFDGKLMIDFNFEGRVSFVPVEGITVDRPWMKIGELNE